MKKLICVVGSTASGKTDFARALAKKINGALISVDSRQVYQSLDIISGKDVPENSKFESYKVIKLKQYSIGYYLFPHNIPIYLLDVVPPTYNFSVNDFVTIATTIIPEISKTHTPILVGGTGFYFDALFKPLATINIPPDLKLRAELEKKTLEEIQGILQTENPEKLVSMNESDRKNKRRLIRAIEVGRSRVIPAKAGIQKDGRTVQGLKDRFWSSQNDVLKIGLTASREVIHKRIDLRVQKRIEQGAVEEAKELFKNYNNLSHGVQDANGYKQLFAYFQGKLSYNEAIETWQYSEYYNAKKQATWFKKDPGIKWFDIESKNFTQYAVELVVGWYNSSK